MSDFNYYNGTTFLGENNTESINYINLVKRAHFEKIRKSIMEYVDNIKAYDEYVSFIAYLIKCLSIPKDTLNTAMILNMITKKGVFSNGHKIITNGSPHDNIYGFLGINVICGHAVCRHMSDFQFDVLNELDLISDIFFVYMSDTEIDNADEKKANHAINLIEYKNNLYGYDSLNGGLYRFVSDRKLEELFSNSAHYMYYKPYSHMMFSIMDDGNINSLLSLFDMIKDKKTISLNEYNDIYDNARSVVSKNSNLLEDFHESSKKYIKRITKNL